MASRMPLFPGFTLSVGYFLFFSHNSFFCMCLHKFWCFQGFPLLGTLLYYTQNPKGFPAQVFYQLYTEPSKNLPSAQISKGLKKQNQSLNSSQVLFLLKLFELRGIRKSTSILSLSMKCQIKKNLLRLIYTLLCLLSTYPQIKQ